MISGLKNLLTLVVFIALSGVSVAAVWHVVRTSPEDQTAEQRQAFLTWLRSPPAGRESLETNRRWIRQLERDFRAGYDWRAAYRGLAPDEQAHMLNHLSDLSTLWLSDKIDRYQRQPSRRREAFLNKEIDELLVWKPVLVAASNTDEKDLWRRVLENTRETISHRSSEDRRHLETYFFVVQRKLMDRMMKSFAPRSPLGG